MRANDTIRDKKLIREVYDVTDLQNTLNYNRFSYHRKTQKKRKLIGRRDFHPDRPYHICTMQAIN
jgi:hypothetical protein